MKKIKNKELRNAVVVVAIIIGLSMTLAFLKVTQDLKDFKDCKNQIGKHITNIKPILLQGKWIIECEYNSVKDEKIFRETKIINSTWRKYFPII